MTSFSDLASLCGALQSTSKRKEKIRLLSDFLKNLPREELASAVLLIIGRAFSETDVRVLEVSGQTIWKIMRRSRQTALVSKPLTIRVVYESLEKIAASKGPRSRRIKEAIIESLLSQASPPEAEYLVRILLGEMRIGVSEGMMLEAIAETAGASSEAVRRTHMSLGDIGKVAELAILEGPSSLRSIEIRLFTPIKPMLAEMAYRLDEVFEAHAGKTAFETKYDGARIQIHKRDDRIRVFSRRLTDVTDSLPDIVQIAEEKINASQVLLEAEAVAVDRNGKLLPFQDLMRRFRRVHEIDRVVKEIPLELHFFDVVFLDGRSLIDTPYQERWMLLERVCPREILASRIVTSEKTEAERFLEQALRQGHEGLMAKALNSLYMPGVRGKRWFKIKPVEFLDLAILAAEWGSGRRTGWLSNYHLAARDSETGEFLVLGKTFKGLTDQEFEEMTRRLLETKTADTEWVVYLKPTIVVEVAYNEIQRSPHYKSGFALRFARITRIRDDKSPAEADTISRVRELYERQFQQKGRIELVRRIKT